MIYFHYFVLENFIIKFTHFLNFALIIYLPILSILTLIILISFQNKLHRWLALKNSFIFRHLLFIISRFIILYCFYLIKLIFLSIDFLTKKHNYFINFLIIRLILISMLAFKSSSFHHYFIFIYVIK